MAISSGSEAERMVWQAERMDERGRLARDWHQLLALYGSLWLFIAPFWLFMAFTALYGSLWLLQLEEAKNQIPRKPARLDPPGVASTLFMTGFPSNVHLTRAAFHTQDTLCD